MSRVAWTFNGYDWPINPEEDSGWIPGELVYSELVPIYKFSSHIQIGGKKSKRRQVRGWIWGEESSDFYQKFNDWHNNRTRATLRDHLGTSQRCICIRFEPEAIKDFKSWAQGRQTWRYNAEFLEV